MNVQIRQGKTVRLLTLGDQVGWGKEGAVYLIRESPESAVKMYHKDSQGKIEHRESRMRKINSMLARPPHTVSAKVPGATLPLLAWPTDLAEDDNRSFAGFVMPYVSNDVAVSLETYLSEIIVSRGRLTEHERCLSTRLMLCRNLASVLADLHSQGYYVIDFKPLNLRVFRESCIPCFLDNDGFSIADKKGQRFPASAFTPEYASPELISGSAAKQPESDAQDRFALAVLIFQILNRGIHPFQGVLVSPPPDGDGTLGNRIRNGHYAYGLHENPTVRPVPHSDHDCIPRATRLLLDRALQPESSSTRPTANEWRKHFDDYLRTRKNPFEKCTARPESLMHIHFAGHPCPECRRTTDLVVWPSPAQAPGAPPSVQTQLGRGRKRVVQLVVALLVLALLWYLSTR